MAEPEEVKLEPDAAPKARRRRGPNKARASIEPRMRVLLTVMGTAWKAADETCGGAFLEAAPELAKSINLWAMQDAKLYAWIEGVTAASGPVAVMAALMPVAQAVAYHHLVPAIQRRREAQEAYVQPSIDEVLEYAEEVA